MRVSAPIALNLRRPFGALAVALSSALLASCDLNPNVDACSVTVAPTTVSITVNGRATVVGTAFDCKGNSIRNKKIAYSTANASIATVAVDGTSNGSVIGIGVGSTTISAVANGKSSTVQVTVGPEVAGTVTVAPSAQTLRVGDSRLFVATLRNAAGIPITGRTTRWTSSNSAIASVDGNGTVTALQPGNVVITAEADGATGSSNVLVTLIPVGFCSLSPLTQKVTVTAQAQPTVTVRDTANRIITAPRPFSWSSNNEIVATVNQSGLVSTRAKGTAVITATSQESPSVRCDFSIEAVDARITQVNIQQKSGFLRISVPRVLSVQLFDSTGSVITVPRTVTWSSVNTATASVTGFGSQVLVNGLAEGTARIAVNAEGVVDTVSLTVTKIPIGRITITPLQTSVREGLTQQFTAVVEDSAGTTVTDRTLAWTSSDPTRATVTNTGLVRTISAGQVFITASSIADNRSSNQAQLIITQTPVDTIVAPATFTLARNAQVGFTITLRDASGNELRNRFVQLTSRDPSIAVVAPNTNTSTVVVGGVSVGTTELTLQALDANGRPEGKITKVNVTVTVPPTGGNLSAAKRSP